MIALYNSNYPILIQGETGTGKTVLAKKIHKISNYRYRKYVHCNLAGLSDALFESELFGHVKGAFTGACIDKIGYCEKVGDGTLFFDEIGDISLVQQKKLLQILDTGEFYKVGSVQKSKFIGRFIFATHRDLEKKVRNGEFREDLFYRLGGVAHTLPSIRSKSLDDRREIINKVILESKGKFNLEMKSFDTASVDLLCSYSWPGNYRELKSVVELVLLKSLRVNVTVKDLPHKFNSHLANDSSFKSQVADLERKILYNEVVNKGVGINKASKSLGISKTTLIAKLRKYGISVKSTEKVSLRVA